MAKAEDRLQLHRVRRPEPKWQGQCPHCGAWNTLVETRGGARAPTRFQTRRRARARRCAPLGSGRARRQTRAFPPASRSSTACWAAASCRGGVVLLGGDPGIGKSTLLLQAMAALGASRKALYVTGEESVEQVALRAQRLGLVNAPVELLAEVQLEAIVAAIGATRRRSSSSTRSRPSTPRR